MPRAPKKCGRATCEVRVVGRPYCDEHTAEVQRRGNTKARGYGAEHQRHRAALAPTVAAGLADCWRCGKPIAAGAPWHDGHDDHDRTQYRGPEHPRCNTQAAAMSKANRAGGAAQR